MPLMDATKMIEEYTTDFGTKVKNLGIKILEGYADKVSEYTERTEENLCPSGNLFQPRALIATFEDGTKVKYPIGDRSNLVARARELLSNGAVCIDYEGEYWPYVPSTLILGISYRSTPLGGFTNDGSKTTGTFNYQSDILGTVVQPFAIESEPAGLVTTAIACLSGIVYGSGFCTSTRSLNIKARRFRGKGLVAGTNRKTYSRDIKMSSPNPTNCGAANAPNYYCLSYIGESIKNLHLLLPES
jgi:hypothetical protein